MKEKIAIIGAGNMGQAIAQGLLSKKIITHDQLMLTNTKTRNNKEAVANADIIILAIKPQMAHLVLDEIKEEVKNQLVISIMAGITIDTLQQKLGKRIGVVRVMPNLGAKVGKSMSVWVKSKEVIAEHKVIVKAILEAIGTELELQEEQQINMATAISGSGPAYFFYLTELLEKAAEELGFSHEKAGLLAIQTMLGSAELLRVSQVSAEELRHAVTSKGGTTEAALSIFDKQKLGKRFVLAVKAAYNRAKELDL